MTYDVHDMAKRNQHAVFGGQEFLYWADATAALGNNPAGLNANAPQGQALAGTALKDLAALIAGTVPGFPVGTITALGPGTYFALFCITGYKQPTIDLQATFAGGTLTSSAFSTFKDEQTSRTAWTGTGAMVSGTLQNPTIAAPNGEQYAVLQLVVGAGASVTAITRAEVLGQRI